MHRSTEAAGGLRQTGARTSTAALRAIVAEHPRAIVERLRTCPKLLVAAVNGAAVGFAAGILGLCDVVYVKRCVATAVPTAEGEQQSTTSPLRKQPVVYVAPYWQLGLVPHGGASGTMVSKMGVAAANDTLLRGAKLGPDAMLRLGLATRVVDVVAGESEEAAFLNAVLADILRARSRNDPGALKQAKKLLSATASAPLAFPLASVPSVGVVSAAVADAEAAGILARFESGEPGHIFARIASRL